MLSTLHGRGYKSKILASGGAYSLQTGALPILFFPLIFLAFFWKTSKDFQSNFFQRGRLKYLMITPMGAVPCQFAGLHVITLINMNFLIYDDFHDLVPSAKFKKREEHPWKYATFGIVSGFSLKFY